MGRVRRRRLDLLAVRASAISSSSPVPTANLASAVPEKFSAGLYEEQEEFLDALRVCERVQWCYCTKVVVLQGVSLSPNACSIACDQRDSCFSFARVQGEVAPLLVSVVFES
jgi:hypothetical protein